MQRVAATRMPHNFQDDSRDGEGEKKKRIGSNMHAHDLFKAVGDVPNHESLPVHDWVS